MAQLPEESNFGIPKGDILPPRSRTRRSPAPSPRPTLARGPQPRAGDAFVSEAINAVNNNLFLGAWRRGHVSRCGAFSRISGGSDQNVPRLAVAGARFRPQTPVAAASPRD